MPCAPTLRRAGLFRRCWYWIQRFWTRDLIVRFANNQRVVLRHRAKSLIAKEVHLAPFPFCNSSKDGRTWWWLCFRRLLFIYEQQQHPLRYEYANPGRSQDRCHVQAKGGSLACGRLHLAPLTGSKEKTYGNLSWACTNVLYSPVRLHDVWTVAVGLIPCSPAKGN